MPYDVRMDNEQNSQSLFSNIAAISKKKGDISEVRSDRISAR